MTQETKVIPTIRTENEFEDLTNKYVVVKKFKNNIFFANAGRHWQTKELNIVKKDYHLVGNTNTAQFIFTKEEAESIKQVKNAGRKKILYAIEPATNYFFIEFSQPYIYLTYTKELIFRVTGKTVYYKNASKKQISLNKGIEEVLERFKEGRRNEIKSEEENIIKHKTLIKAVEDEDNIRIMENAAKQAEEQRYSVLAKEMDLLYGN